MHRAQKVQELVLSVGARARMRLYGAEDGRSFTDTISALYSADTAAELANMSREIDELFKGTKSMNVFVFGKAAVPKGTKPTSGPSTSSDGAGSVAEAMAKTLAEVEEAVSIGDVTYMKQMMSVLEALNSVHAAAVSIDTVYLPVLRASQLALDAYHEARRKPNADADALEADLLDTLSQHRAALPASLPVIKAITPYGYGVQPVPERIEEQMGRSDNIKLFPMATIEAAETNCEDACAALSTQAEQRAKVWAKTL